MKKAIVIALAGATIGASVMRFVDANQIVTARQNEGQASGREDECKATLKAQLQTVFREQANGDYELAVYGGRRMVCEEKDVVIAHQPDAIEPLVVDCKH